jgi:hypothetical protein
VLDAMLPLRPINAMNVREHWSKRAARAQKQRRDTYYGLLSIKPSPQPPGRLEVTMTRLYPPTGRPMDSDGIAASFKAIRDGIADWLGIDDGSARVEWKYRQEKHAIFAIRVQINDLGEQDGRKLDTSAVPVDS